MIFKVFMIQGRTNPLLVLALLEILICRSHSHVEEAKGFSSPGFTSFP